ncbi:S24 family peptidase [Capnocytophaga leadbetteri]|uniref:S24 family peptidase n=1 Tax=Capnocytophaga leadbetteri TaxID=327575 RepID=UPI0028E5018D|nr:S24 family peptidase [Capnocytophaga leadbetteri]
MIVERIRQIIDYKKISTRQFCIEVGVANGFLDKVKDVGSEKLLKILNTYPELSPEWLLTGKGDMLKPEHENQSQEVTIIKGNRKTRDAIIDIQEIPLYDLDATTGLSAFFKGDKKASIIDTIKIPNAPRCDGAFGVVGDSMVPLLRSGDTILYKEVPLNIDYIMFGEMYVLSYDLGDWEEVIAVKYIHKSKRGKNYIKLVSENPNHADKDIPFASIKALALVKVTIRFNTPY